MFGYFPAGQGKARRTVFTCLSHDILAHEATHALLDGLRTRYTDPSSPDQAAFHEAFADIVALLAVFSMRGVVDALLKPERRGKTMVQVRDFDGAWLRDSPLLAMAEQFGQALEVTPHRRALRLSLLLEPSPSHYADFGEFGEPHRRADILVAATLRAFVAMWKRALWGRRVAPKHPIPIDVVVAEGCELAQRLLTMVIRAIDYAPVVDIHFADFLTALVTADRELYLTDDKYVARSTLIEYFRAYGTAPVTGDDGVWVSMNLLAEGDVSQQEIDGKWIIVVHVPRATRKQRPVDLGGIGPRSTCGSANHQDRPDLEDPSRWSDWITPDGTWLGNLFDFFRRVIPRIKSDLKVPFELDADLVREHWVEPPIADDMSGDFSVLRLSHASLHPRKPPPKPPQLPPQSFPQTPPQSFPRSSPQSPRALGIIAEVTSGPWAPSERVEAAIVEVSRGRFLPAREIAETLNCSRQRFGGSQ